MEGHRQFQTQDKQSQMPGVVVAVAVTDHQLWERRVWSLHVEQEVEDHLVFVTQSHAMQVQLDSMEMCLSQQLFLLKAATVLPEVPEGIHK